MMKSSRVFKHEDSGVGAKVFYNVSLENLGGTKPSLRFDIEKMQNEIYHNSKRDKVIVPPNVVSVILSTHETIKLVGLFVEAVSLYMSAIRKKLYFSNTLRLELSPKNSDYKIIFHAVNKKVSGLGKEKNSARLIMSFFDKKTDEEVLSVKLKKTKIVILIQIIKSLYEENMQRYSFSYEDISGRRLSMIRIEDTVAIGDVWIHGREIQKFQDYVERVIFDFKFKVGDGQEMFNYRQVSTEFAFSQNVARLNLTKYNEDHSVYKDKNENSIKHSFLINSEATAIFYLLLPKAIGFSAEDVEIHAQENINDSAILDKKRISSIEDGDFILNMIESQLVLSVNKDEEFSAKKRTGKLKMAVRYRDYIVSDDTIKVGRTNSDTGLYEEVRKLPKCVIDMKIDWLYIFALCAESIHSAKEMNLNEFGNHVHSWRFKELSLLGGEHYGVRIVTDPGNKVPAVMMIDYHNDESGELNDSPLPSTGGSRMRIPLFKEHIRTLIKGLVALSGQYDEYYWMRKFPVYSDDFDEIVGKMSLGFRRYYDVKMKKEVVSFGVVGRSTEQIYLTDNDRDTLFFSAYYRLMYGRWLQFSGEQISISFDGWLTDRFNEYKIEFDLEDSSGARGSLPALAMLFATSRVKKNFNVEEKSASSTTDSKG